MTATMTKWKDMALNRVEAGNIHSYNIKETAYRFKSLSFNTNDENTLTNMFCIKVCVGVCRVERAEFWLPGQSGVHHPCQE